LTNNIVCYK